MKIAYIIAIFISFFGYADMYAQEKRSISFVFTFNNNPIDLGKNYYSENLKDSVQITQLKMYIGNMIILTDDLIIDSVLKNYHLLDLENPTSLVVQSNILSNQHFDRLQFHLGVDSLTNVLGAMGGDLDPTNGMYWAWQSGYINFKLEGVSKVCNTRKNNFQFHLGGYQFPNNSFRKVSLSVLDTDLIVIFIPVDKFLERVDLKINTEVMSPGPKAMTYSNYLSEAIFTK